MMKKAIMQINVLKMRRILFAQLAYCFMVFMPVPSYAADTAKGGELYAMHCASCHGVSGAGIMPNAPSFNQGEGLLQPDLALLNAIKSGKNAMPAYQGILSDRDILDVVAYLRTLN